MVLKMEKELQILDEKEKISDWIHENISSIRKSYEEEFIAVEKDKNIISDKELSSLISRIKRSGKTPSELVIQFVHKKGEVVFF